MFKDICSKFNLDYTRFHRDYYENQIKRGEKIIEEDLHYCFIESNLQLKECVEIFNVSYSKLRGDLFFYKIFKSPIQQQQNREKNCLAKHGVINPSCLPEIIEKRRNTNLERYGCINSSMDPEIKEKTRKTMNERFGGNAPACSKEILNKIKQTNLKRYGAEWQWKTDEGKQHREEVCLKKYGVKNLMQLLEIQNKCKETNLKRYGVENPSVLPEIKEKVKKTNLKKYGTDNPMELEEIKQKIKQTTFKNYGVQNIFQSSKVKEKAKQAIIEKYGVTSTSLVPEIMEKMKEGRARWRQSSKYKEKRIEMTKHCWETRKKNGTCNTSRDEKQIFELLRQKFLEVKREYKSESYPFHCDFYIPEKDLYIEYQGFWTHLNEPFIGTEDQLKKVEWLKMKSNELNYKNKRKNMYKIAIDVWTISDPLKRETARKNNLNWIEFFTMDEFMKWYDLI